MTVLDDVGRLDSRLSSEPICDDCIADRLGLSVRQNVSRTTRELAGTDGFERSKDACSICGAAKPVIQHRNRRAG